MDPVIESIQAKNGRTHRRLLKLNNANAGHTSLLTIDQWHHLVEQSFVAHCVKGPVSLLIALDQDAEYDSPNFIWFRSRLAKFVYVDRIVVAEEQQGRGLASLMYQELFARALAAGHDRIVCEINLVPPNPRSHVFHERWEFKEIGQAILPPGNKKVRYLAKNLKFD